MTSSTPTRFERSPSNAALHALRVDVRASLALSLALPSPTARYQWPLPSPIHQQIATSRRPSAQAPKCSRKALKRRLVNAWKHFSRVTRQLGIISGYGVAEQRASRLLPDGFILVPTAQRHTASLKRKSIIAA